MDTKGRNTMSTILSSLFNPYIVEQAGSIEMAMFVFAVLILAIFVLMTMLVDLLERKRPRYIVSKSFLKMEERGGIDLNQWSNEIKVTHEYYTGPLLVNK